MSPSPHILAIHGIRTRLTNPAWPWRFAAYVDRMGIAAHVETEHYKAGPFPRLNTWLVNPPVAKALANRVLMRRELLGAEPVHILAHSNGAVVAVAVAKRLAKAGVPVASLVLVGAAVHSDVRRSGLLDLRRRHLLDRAVCYSSPADPVIRHLQTFPGAYGSLGARGFDLRGQRHGVEVAGYADAPPFAPFVTRRFDGFRHSEYFSAAWAEQTFSTALCDMGFDLVPY